MPVIVRNQYGREIAVYGKYSFTGSTEKFTKHPSRGQY